MTERTNGGGHDVSAVPPASTRLFDVVRNGLSVIGPDRPRLYAAVALAVVVGAIETVLLCVVAAVAIAMSGERGTVRLGPESLDFHLNLMSACRFGLLLAALLMVLSWPLARLMASLSTRAMLRLRSRMLESYLGSSLEYRETQREGLLQQLVGEYALRAENSIQQLANAAVALAMLATLMAGALVSAPTAAVGMIAALLSCWAAFALVSRWLRQDTSAPVLTNREIVGRVAQAARMGEEISAYDLSGPVCRELEGDVRKSAEAMGRLRVEARLFPNIFQYGAIGLVLVLVTLLANVRPDELGGLAPLALLLLRSLGYVRQLQRSFHTAREMAPYIAAIETELTALDMHGHPAGGRTIEDIAAIAFHRVSYAYKPGMPALRDIEFTIGLGEAIGIVGPSGSGKSTLVGLLLRLRMPGAGSVMVDGIPLEQISARSWARLVGYVPQDSRLLYGTVADNIRLFRPGFDDAQVAGAARAAGLHEEIMALPQGYETKVGPGARGLSGGQTQRLSIARALIGTPRVLVMDEPTSALDAWSEQLIAEALAALKGRTTIVLVAHRPATVAMCDRVFEVRDGRLREFSRNDRLSHALAV
ncbi:MAG TPA: ATP-binding cassette domain-containing protein [Novosphingobium sp.]|nr:ATP-binding cassette domain-containing protein [Novosphingobium sp.]